MNSINKVDLLGELLLGDSGLLIALRMGDGLNTVLVDEICTVLDELRIEWSDKDSIPKKAVDLFVDFYSVIESCEGLYSENEFLKILQAADKILVHIRQCYSD